MMAVVRGSQYERCKADEERVSDIAAGIAFERKRATLVAKTTIQNFFMERPELMGLVPAIALRDLVVEAIESGQP